MDDDLVQLLEKISQQTGMPVEAIIRLAVLEFVHSFDLDFAGAPQAPIKAPEDRESA